MNRPCGDCLYAMEGGLHYKHCETCKCCTPGPEEKKVKRFLESITSLAWAAENFDAGILQTVIRGNDNQITQAIIVLRGDGIQDVLDAIETVTEMW